MARRTGETPTSAWPGISPQTLKRSQMAFPCPQGSWTKLTCTKRLHPGPAPHSQDVLAVGTSAEHQQDVGCRERNIRDKAKTGGRQEPVPAQHTGLLPKTVLWVFVSQEKPCSRRGGKFLSPCLGREGAELAAKPPAPTPGRPPPCPWRHPPSAEGPQWGRSCGCLVRR